MAQFATNTETRTKNDLTPEQTVLVRLARMTSEADGGNGFNIDPLKESEATLRPRTLASSSSRVTVALMKHPEAGKDESFAALKILEDWLEDVTFIRSRSNQIRSDRTIWGVLDALDQRNADDHRRLFVHCHRRDTAAQALLSRWKKEFDFLKTL